MKADRAQSTHKREHVRGPVLDGMGEFVIVKANMSQVNFQEVLFKQKVRP